MGSPAEVAAAVAGRASIVVMVWRNLRYAEPMSKTPLPKPITEETLENAALHYLERFSASAESLRRVLMRRVWRVAAALGEEPERGAALVDALIARYLLSGLLDDRRYAEAKSRSLLRRGAPLSSIRQSLGQKGVEGGVVQAVLDELDEECQDQGIDADLSAALAYARRRRLGPYRPPEKRPSHRDRDLASMGRAGFSWDLARRVIDGETE
jgi:regulatory protein